MQDLSNILPGDPVSCLVPTSQAGGNQVSSNANARTAPGSQPSTPFRSFDNEVIDHEPPAVVAEVHTRVTVTDCREAPNATPYSRADGTPWAETDATDDVITGQAQPMIRMGRWNSV